MIQLQNAGSANSLIRSIEKESEETMYIKENTNGLLLAQ